MKLTGKEFEALLLFRAQKLEEDRILTLGRYGTQVVMMNDEQGVPRWQPIPSLPDLEGVIFGSGRQLIMEAKACSQASHPIHQQGKKHPRQVDHMMRRARFGALCYYVIHFNPRELVKKSEPAVTYAIPVDQEAFFWREYEAAERLSVNREDCERYGIEIPWNLYSSRAKNPTPDLRVLIEPSFIPEAPLLNL